MVMIEGFSYGDGGGGNPREVVGDPMDGVGQVEGACRQWYLQVKKKK